ncbi:MAG: hypothetical protein BWY68_00800 [bacterium ADurb.Bin400]|nr:MAG: hypothetical protein BWY68_00800 [bacterium ADurb.Bin400]
MRVSDQLKKEVGTVEVKKIVGQDLSGWRVERWYQLNAPTGETGSKVIGYFKDENLAIAYGKGKGWFNSNATTCGVFVLTKDGRTGFLLNPSNVCLVDEDDCRARVVGEIKAKLSPEEVALLR